MLNRRKMMGVAVGGAFAAPQMAKAAAAQRSNWVGTPAVGLQGGMDKSAAEFTAEQLARMKRIASGDIRDEDRNYPTEGSPAFVSLRSVSLEAQYFMRNRRYERQWRERTIKMALDTLDHYDKTGILRSFF